MLTKAILPLPDKFHGLKDTEKRYRSRHLDMIANPNVRDTFRKRAAITSKIRRLLDDQGFLEIETPTMHTQSGGAEAKPFETYHNSMTSVIRVASGVINSHHRRWELSNDLFIFDGIKACSIWIENQSNKNYCEAQINKKDFAWI